MPAKTTPTPAKGVDRRPSGKYRARLTYRGQQYTSEWDTEKQAAAWIQRTRRELAAGTYVAQVIADPETGKNLPPTLGDYCHTWLEQRDLRPRTSAEYARMMPNFKPLARYRLDQLDTGKVKAWHAALKLPATRKAHVYSLLRTILNTAVEDELIPANPCRIRKAGVVKKRAKGELPTPAQIHDLADLMPPKYRVMTLVSAWCGLRFGETTELRRRDIALDDNGVPVVIRVRRAVVRVEGEYLVGPTKSEAGERDVTIPPHIREDLRGWLATLPADPDALLFPGSRNGRHMAPSSLYKPFYPARVKMGMPTLRWHDLRHFAATEVAKTGATTAEIMGRIGHSTFQAAMKYQHAARARDTEIAEKLSNVVELRRRPA